MVETAFRCDDVLWRRFTALCRERDETPDAVLRDVVRLEVHRCERRKARSAEGIDQRLLARLRLLVVEALVVIPKAGSAAIDASGTRPSLHTRGRRPDPRRPRRWCNSGQGKPGRPALSGPGPSLRTGISRPPERRSRGPGARPGWPTRA